MNGTTATFSQVLLNAERISALLPKLQGFHPKETELKLLFGFWSQAKMESPKWLPAGNLECSEIAFTSPKEIFFGRTTPHPVLKLIYLGTSLCRDVRDAAQLS